MYDFLVQWQRKIKETDTERLVSRSLVHSADGCNGQSWASLKPELHLGLSHGLQ